MKLLLQVTLLIALLGTHISPACHFFSGKDGFIEICGPSSGVKYIYAPDYVIPDSEEENALDLDQCPFCFQTASLSGVFDPLQIYQPILFMASAHEKQTTQIIQGNRPEISYASPRDPPTISFA